MADPLLDIPPPLGPLDLGLSEPPQAPAMPQLGAAPPDFKAKLLRLIAAGIAGGLGPGKGTGLLQGANLADQHRAREQQQKDQQARLLYGEQQDQYAQQSRMYEQEADQRRAAFERTAQQLERVAPTLKSKADFDRTVEVYAQGLGNYGIRNAGLQLRQRVQYAEPKAADRANAVLEKFFGDKVNQRLLDHPEELQNRTFLVDLDGDGTSNRVSLAQLLRVAKRTELLDPATGKLGLLPKGTPAEKKFGIEQRYQNLLTIARADGKLVDGDSAEAARNQNVLMDKAKREDKEAGDLGPDPLVSEMRALRLERERNAPAAQHPPAVQRRIDAISKGFDAQPAVKRTQMLAEAVAFADSLDINTQNPADDQALIYAFAKAMDPESVVREGEYATVQKYAQAWAQSFGFNAARIFSNTPFLTSQARQNMKNTIRSRFQAGRGQYVNLRRSYAGRIDRITGQPGAGESELVDYGGGFPEEPPAATAPTPGSAREKYRQRQGVK